MSETNSKKEFAENLLAQDPPTVDKQRHHQEILFKKLKRLIWLGKIIVGTIYIILFSAAFLAFQLRRNTDNLVHSICWGAASLHILLWFLIYFLRGIYRMTAGISEKNSGKDEKQRWKKQDRFITIVAILVFAFASTILYRSFFLNDPLRAAHLAASIFWATVFFLFWYPFGTASLLAKLWLEYKKMELNIPKTEEQNLKSQTE
jgi:O-antigen/teichoic acid export membrane protein